MKMIDDRYRQYYQEHIRVKDRPIKYEHKTDWIILFTIPFSFCMYLLLKVVDRIKNKWYLKKR
jgi:hypothetical protein